MRLPVLLFVAASLSAASQAAAVTATSPGGCPGGTTPVQTSGGTYSGGSGGVHVWYNCIPQQPRFGGTGCAALGAPPKGGYKKQVRAGGTCR